MWMKNEVVLCGCKRGNKISSEIVAKWTDFLDKEKIAYTFIEDLCGAVARGDLKIEDVYNGKKAVVIGCQPKAMKNLLKRAGISVNGKDFDLHHAEQTSFEEIKPEEFSIGEKKLIKYDGDWKPWYPVIDYDLCTSCQKCLNFCLFGVYSLNDKGEVIAENPDKCKDLCPACARTCPKGAIVFPKHNESPIDGGEGEFSEEQNQSYLTQIQQSSNVYEVLANRRKASGMSLFKANQLQIAKEERDKCKDDD